MYWQKRQTSRETKKQKQLSVSLTLLVILIAGLISEYVIGQFGTRDSLIRIWNTGVLVSLAGHIGICTILD